MSRTKVIIIYFGQSKQIYISVSAPNYFQNQILINVSKIIFWFVFVSTKRRVLSSDIVCIQIRICSSVYSLSAFNNCTSLLFNTNPTLSTTMMNL